MGGNLGWQPWGDVILHQVAVVFHVFVALPLLITGERARTAAISGYSIFFCCLYFASIPSVDIVFSLTWPSSSGRPERFPMFAVIMTSSGAFLWSI